MAELLACLGLIEVIAERSGICSTAPTLSRLILPSAKASGLRSKIDIISCETVTPFSRNFSAMRNRLSFGCTGPYACAFCANAGLPARLHAMRHKIRIDFFIGYLVVVIVNQRLSFISVLTPDADARPGPIRAITTT